MQERSQSKFSDVHPEVMNAARRLARQRETEASPDEPLTPEDTKPETIVRRISSQAIRVTGRISDAITRVPEPREEA